MFPIINMAIPENPMYSQSLSVAVALFEKAHLKQSRKLVSGFKETTFCMVGVKSEIG
jgi:hypothetical protein